MPANVGEMFYFGDVPWHKEGSKLDRPATVEEALKAGGLDWQVEGIALRTADDPPSPVFKRKALVRLDRPAGHEGRVVGVVHNDFTPVQNRDGALLFDSIFGNGKRVYHTGGYLGNGEVVWLLAKIDKRMEIAKDDVVAPYALFANSHDGSMAFNIRLTTIRVVCQNTLSMAMDERGFGQQFRRAHQGSFLVHAEAAQEFFGAALSQLDVVAKDFTNLTKKRCDDIKFKKILDALLPEPKKPRNADSNPAVKKTWETRVAGVLDARKQIDELRENGKGMALDGSRGTLWGVLNAVLEYVDHHKETKGSHVSYTLMGEGMKLKEKAYRLIQGAAKAA